MVMHQRNTESLDYLGGLLPYYELDIDTKDAVSSQLDLAQLHRTLDGGPIGVWLYGHAELEKVYTATWLRYMHSIGLDVGSAMIFYRDAHYVYPGVHIDIYKNSQLVSHYAINFVLDANDDSDMIWYSYPKGITEFPALSSTPADTPYVGWPLDGYAGQELYRYTIGRRMTLINTSMPHNVETRSRARWVISTRFPRVANNNADESWQRAVEFFQKYFKKQ